MLFHSVLTTAILAPVVGMHFSLSSTEDMVSLPPAAAKERQQVAIDADGNSWTRTSHLSENDDDKGKEPGKDLKKAKKPRRAKRLCNKATKNLDADQVRVCACRNFLKDGVQHIYGLLNDHAGKAKAAIEKEAANDGVDAGTVKDVEGKVESDIKTGQIVADLGMVCKQAKQLKDWTLIAKMINHPTEVVPNFKAANIEGWEHCAKSWIIEGACAEIVKETAPLARQPVVLQDTWDHHFKAFGGQNLDEIVKDYSDGAEINIVNWVDGSMQTYRGLEGVRKAFAELFAQMSDLSDLGAPVVQVDERRGTVFLIWKNPASGYKYGTDSFVVDSKGKFFRQHVVVSKLGSDAAAAVVPDPAKVGLPTHSAWKRHFAAFGSQSVDDIVVDYAKDTKINVYNQADGSLTTYHGHSGVRDCFKELFANLHDTSDLTAPVQVVEEGGGNRPGRVLLLWSCPASGYLNGTDTFVTNQEGKFTQQNVVVNYQRKTPAPKTGCENFFGRGAASLNQIISIVDPDVPALFCDLFNQKAPCTFIHRAQASGGSNCVSPTPPDKCHKYIKVTYSKCDGLEATKAGTVDVTGRFDPQTGVFKGCEGNVTSTDYTYWAPNKPISDKPPPTFPDTYEAIKCSPEDLVEK